MATTDAKARDEMVEGMQSLIQWLVDRQADSTDIGKEVEALMNVCEQFVSEDTIDDFYRELARKLKK